MATMKYKYWTPAERENLTQMCADGKSSKFIAKELNRSVFSVDAYISDKKIKRTNGVPPTIPLYSPHHQWSIDDDIIIRTMAATNACARTIAIALGVTRNAVIGRAHRRSIPLAK